MPTVSLIALAIGAKQLVVHEAFEIIWLCALSTSLLTPCTTVASISLPGAETITFLAPAVMCLAAASRLVNKPVHSKTISTFNAFHGKFAGSRSCVKVITSSPISIVLSASVTLCENCPCTESNCVR